jgi:hypothetical protein
MNSSDQGATLPVKAQYKYSTAETSQGLRMHLRWNSPTQVFRVILGWIMVFFGVCTLLRGKVALPKTIPIIGMILLGLLFIFRNRFIDWAFKLRFRNNPNKDALVRWTFSPETISSEGEGFNFTMSWNEVFAFIDSSKGFLIYPQKQLFHWIPFSGFKSEAEVDCVRQTAKSQVVTYKKVN